jgi:hypothetical protein
MRAAAHLQRRLQGLGHDRSRAGLLQDEAVADVVRAHVALHIGEVLVERPHCAVVGACRVPNEQVRTLFVSTLFPAL